MLGVTVPLGQQLEMMGAGGDLTEAPRLVGELESEFSALVEALTAFVSEGDEPSDARDVAGNGSND